MSFGARSGSLRSSMLIALVVATAFAGPRAAPSPRRESASRAAPNTTAAPARDPAATPTPPPLPTTVSGDVPVRMLPTTVAVEALDAPTLAPASDAWALLDGDPAHGLDASAGAVRVRFALASVRAIDGLALRSSGPGRLVAYVTRGAVHSPIASIDLPVAQNTWQRLRADRGATGDAIVVEWRPATPTSQLGEVELWGLAAFFGVSAIAEIGRAHV